MESQVVRRRVNMIVSHLAGNEDLPAATHLLPLNCSSSINSVARRCDNRMLFARQGSISQARFMRQVSIDESSGESNKSHNGVPPHSSCSAIIDSSCNPMGAPLFSRPIQMKPQASIVEYRPAKQDCQLSMEDPPKFSRPYKGVDGHNKNFTKNVRSDVKELSPRMDVAESKWHYVMTVELPAGSSMNSIRVEVDERNLIVMGKRSTQRWRASSGSRDSVSTYQNRDTIQGPYQIVWPLPNNVNKDRISAEIVNGVLRITLPKL
ncbi:alpha-crystallin domain 32.1 [Thalictrum thalictroides]|uniref:Alpha-crystallin domain 32.1 n=1 Tax=Thalictrum thalictroides TaxID=46969 RepID=A0A7J6VGR7_THATH|nr:alpha-crystallin domain 32.1 [Thalictrum thalictroides]